MPTKTYKPLANLTLSTSAASVTFGSIPSTYRDLVLIIAGTRTGDNNVQIRFNSDTGSNYTWVWARGNGSIAESGSETLSFIPLAALALTTNAQLNGIVHIMDYSATDKHKAVLSRFSQDSTQSVMSANRWANTAAINTIQIFTGNNDFGSGSTFALYGIES